MRTSLLSGFRKYLPHWVMAALFLGGLTVAGILYGLGAEPNGPQWELAKMSMQVAVVAVAGALLSFVADRYRKSEERARLREDQLKEVLRRFTSSYNKSKGCRRIARGRILPGIDQDKSIEADVYDKIIAELNEAQLDLEAVKRDLETSGKLFPSDVPLVKIARSMEKYLNGIVDEYERKRHKAGGDPPATLKLSELGRFKSFLDDTDRWAFDQYASLHGNARDLINKELMELTARGS